MLNHQSQFKTVRTTVAIPEDLMKRTQHFVEHGTVPNRNALIVAALEQFVKELERQEIDRQFDLMAEDEAYQTLNEKIAEGFSESDWEALEKGEGHAPG
ncbi:MAG: CopG family transcriptional regulator [Chloroflexota bacterium]